MTATKLANNAIKLTFAEISLDKEGQWGLISSLQLKGFIVTDKTFEFCSICGCILHRDGDYAEPTVKGRSHATEHHHVPERFFGRSKNRRSTQREKIFRECPWGFEGHKSVFCYECHEELLHNPVFLPEDIEKFAEIVRKRGLAEISKSTSRSLIAGRIKLFHEVITAGIEGLRSPQTPGVVMKDAQTAEKVIRMKFASTGSPAIIPLMRARKFNATLTEAGIEVDNLRSQKLLPWAVFETTLQILREGGGSALRGNAMGFRLGDEELPLHSVEGGVAYRLYNKALGDAVFRRISPIAGIMVWAGICSTANKRLNLI